MNKTNQIVGIIKRSFTYTDRVMFFKWYAKEETWKMLYTFKCVSKHNTIRRFYVNIFKFLICILHLPLNLENYIWVVKFEKLYFYFGYEIFILDVKNVRNIRIPTTFFLFALDKEFLLPVKGLSTLNILRNPKVPGLFWPWKEGGGHYPLFAQFVKRTDKSLKYWKKVPPD